MSSIIITQHNGITSAIWPGCIGPVCMESCVKVPDSTATPLDFITEQRYVVQLSRLNIRRDIGMSGQCHVPKVQYQASSGCMYAFLGLHCTSSARCQGLNNSLSFCSFKVLIKLCFDENVEEPSTVAGYYWLWCQMCVLLWDQVVWNF